MEKRSGVWLVSGRLVMKKKLTQADVAFYREFGYVAPVDVMSPIDAKQLFLQFEDAEKRFPEALSASSRTNAHLTFMCIDAIAHNEAILDAVENLIGSDFYLRESVIFAKPPDNEGFVSWHQDAIYMGLTPYDFVNVWCALTESSDEAGCLRVIPGSHLGSLRAHEDTFAEKNMLTRGHQIENVNENLARNILLKPGQASFHHPKMIHGSLPNRSLNRRVGVAFWYVAAHVQLTIGKRFILPMRGRCPDTESTVLNRPEKDMSAESVAQRAMVRQNYENIMYRGTDRARRY